MSGFQNIIDRCKRTFEDQSMCTMNNRYFTHSQFVKKFGSFQSEKRELRLHFLNTTFKNSRLSGTLHQRFLINISEQNVPRLQPLLSVALRKGRGLSYIISQVLNAVDGLYTANANQDDKDLAFLVLKFGGPIILDIIFFLRLLAFYVFVEMSISDQLKAISISSYLLFYLIKQNTTSLIPALLYSDLQCTFHDALFSAAKMKISSPEKPLYLVEMGQIHLNAIFGTGRMDNHSNVMDALGLINISRSMASDFSRKAS